MTTEIFENTTFPDGSVLTFGSASHLGRAGTSFYAGGWTNVIAQPSGTGRRVRVCPLIPLIASDCPGTIAHDLTELWMLLSTVYNNNNTLDPHDAWTSLLEPVENNSTGSVRLREMNS